MGLPYLYGMLLDDCVDGSSSLVHVIILCVCVCGLLKCTCCTDCTDVSTLDARLLASSRYPEGPVTGHLGIGFSWFPSV
jgi:hypothetical protein